MPSTAPRLVIITIEAKPECALFHERTDLRKMPADDVLRDDPVVSRGVLREDDLGRQVQHERHGRDAAALGS